MCTPRDTVPAMNKGSSDSWYPRQGACIVKGASHNCSCCIYLSLRVEMSCPADKPCYRPLQNLFAALDVVRTPALCTAWSWGASKCGGDRQQPDATAADT